MPVLPALLGSAALLGRVLAPAPHVRALAELAGAVRRQRSIVFELARRDLIAEHRGKRLGSVWGLVQPLFVLAVYGVVYTAVFNVRIGGGLTGGRSFTVFLLSGLVPWLAFQLSMAKATSLVTGNSALVKQMVFDMRLVPVASTLASCLPLLLGLGFIAVWTLVADGTVPWTYALIPLVVCCQLAAMAGVSFALAALGVFVRDIRDLVQLASVVLIFLLPVVYLPGAEPSALSTVIRINPWSAMVHCYQDVFALGRIAHPWDWVGFAGGSLLACAAGYRVYRRTQPLFGDLL